MTSRPVHAGLSALLLGALLTACAGTSPSASPPTATTTVAGTPLPAAPPSAAVTPTSSPRPKMPTAPATATEEVTQLSLTVAGDEVTGDSPLVQLRVGQAVRLTVTSDVADEVHVHGADVSADVEAGGTAVLTFTQDAPGRFEVELEGARRVLTRLQVR